MRIISHRGYWHQQPERNLPEAFHRSFDLGFGTETDVRDVAGLLVISHDMPSGNELSVDALLEIMAGRNLPLAINVKADGMAMALKKTFERHGHTNWFVFDMSIPDMRAYLTEGIATYTRISDVEVAPVLIGQAAGVWLDGFEGDWFSNKVVADLLVQGKQVCVVSPELHGRDPEVLWRQLSDLKSQDGLMLCTDRPADANKFFQ